MFRDPYIETSRCIIRCMEEEDVADLYAYMKNSETTKYLSIDSHQSIDETLYYLKSTLLSFRQQGIPQTLAVIHKEEDRMIAHMHIHTIEDGIGELGFVVHPAYQHQGYMKEVLPVLLTLGFQEVQLRKVTAVCTIENQACKHLLKRLNFQEEGCLRKYVKLQDAKYHDAILLSLFEEEMKG